MALAAIVVPTAIGLASASFYFVERPIVRIRRPRLRGDLLRTRSPKCTRWFFVNRSTTGPTAVFAATMKLMEVAPNRDK